MGWWMMDLDGIETSSGKKASLVMGDGPADTMGAALQEIIDEYKAAWERPPTVDELRECFEFVLGGVKEELEPEVKRPKGRRGRPDGARIARRTS